MLVENPHPSKITRADMWIDVERWADPTALRAMFLHCVDACPGVRRIDWQAHMFPGGGITVLVVLAESHAALHTWPEHGLAWVDIATCGDPTSVDAFRVLVRQTLGPEVPARKADVDGVHLTRPDPP